MASPRACSRVSRTTVVNELAGEIGQSVANTSQHLQHFLRAGVVRTRRQGTRVLYSLTGPTVGQLWTLLRQVAEDHAAGLDDLAAAYLGDRTGLDTVSRTDLLERMRAGDVVVLDVRPVAEYRAGHIACAIWVPVQDLEHRLRELPADRQAVAYCRGPYCAYADDAVRLLRRRRRRAARLDDGFPEWAAAGLPVQLGRTG